jgi:cytochrome P450
MDVMADLARVLPVMVIAELLGIPSEDHGRFRLWSDQIAMALDPMHVFTSREGGDRAIEELTAYLETAAAERRRRPGPDLLSALLAAEEAEDRLTGAELLATVSMLLFAGNETTTNLIGNGMLALLRNPAELDRLARDPRLLRPAVEELLRYDTPVQSVVRVAHAALELGGRTIQPEQRLILNLGAANRDPAQFPDPDRLDVGRADNRHLAFGSGVHFCLGAPLARAAAAAAIGAMVRRLKALRLAAPGPERRPTLLLRGLDRLPVEFEAVG